MANLLRGGFRPANGYENARCRRYEVATAVAAAIFPGDACTLLTDGTVIAGINALDPAQILGVVSRCSYVGSNGGRVETYVPAGTAYTPTTRNSPNSTWVWVWDDPNTEFEVCMAANAATDTMLEGWAIVGSNMDLVATAGNTIYARSGHTLSGIPVAGTAHFRIVGICNDPKNEVATDAAWAAGNVRVRCTINEGQHAFFNTAGI